MKVLSDPGVGRFLWSGWLSCSPADARESLRTPGCSCRPCLKPQSPRARGQLNSTGAQSGGAHLLPCTLEGTPIHTESTALSVFGPGRYPRSGINETQAGRLPVRDLGPASPRPGPCFCRLRKTLALKKWLIGRGGGRQHFVGKTPRVGVVCTPSSPAAAPDEEAATATATVQALSPQKRQWRRVLSAAADRR